MNDTALSVLLATAIAILGFWVLVGLLLIVLWRMVKRRIKRFEAYVNQPAFRTGDLNLAKPRETLTKAETDQIRDLLRHRKECEARDQATIDTATEFNREI